MVLTQMGEFQRRIHWFLASQHVTRALFFTQCQLTASIQESAEGILVAQRCSNDELLNSIVLEKIPHGR